MLALGGLWVWARSLAGTCHTQAPLRPPDFFIMVMAVLDFMLMQLNYLSSRTIYHQSFRIFKVFKSLRALRAIRVLRRLRSAGHSCLP